MRNDIDGALRAPCAICRRAFESELPAERYCSVCEEIGKAWDVILGLMTGILPEAGRTAAQLVRLRQREALLEMLPAGKVPCSALRGIHEKQFAVLDSRAEKAAAANRDRAEQELHDVKETLTRASETAPDYVENIRRILRTMGYNRAMRYWLVGDQLVQADKAVPLQSAVIGKLVGVSDRLIRYCAQIRGVLNRQQAEDLTESKVPWYVMREIVGAASVSTRERLIASWLSGTYVSPFKGAGEANRRSCAICGKGLTGRRTSNCGSVECIAERNRRQQHDWHKKKAQAGLSLVTAPAPAAVASAT